MDLLVSPDKVGLRIAGVMDNHLLLAKEALTATRGAEDSVKFKKGDGEQGGQDV